MSNYSQFIGGFGRFQDINFEGGDGIVPYGCPAMGAGGITGRPWSQIFSIDNAGSQGGLTKVGSSSGFNIVRKNMPSVMVTTPFNPRIYDSYQGTSYRCMICNIGGVRPGSTVDNLSNTDNDYFNGPMDFRDTGAYGGIIVFENIKISNQLDKVGLTYNYGGTVPTYASLPSFEEPNPPDFQYVRLNEVYIVLNDETTGLTNVGYIAVSKGIPPTNNNLPDDFFNYEWKYYGVYTTIPVIDDNKPIRGIFAPDIPKPPEFNGPITILPPFDHPVEKEITFTVSGAKRIYGCSIESYSDVFTVPQTTRINLPDTVTWNYFYIGVEGNDTVLINAPLLEDIVGSDIRRMVVAGKPENLTPSIINFDNTSLSQRSVDYLLNLLLQRAIRNDVGGTTQRDAITYILQGGCSAPSRKGIEDFNTLTSAPYNSVILIN